MTDKFKTKKGELTLYALACGYRQVVSDGNVRVCLYGESGVVHVVGYDFAKGARLFWHSFPFAKVANARALFKGKAKELGLSIHR